VGEVDFDMVVLAIASAARTHAALLLRPPCGTTIVSSGLEISSLIEEVDVAARTSNGIFNPPCGEALFGESDLVQEVQLVIEPARTNDVLRTPDAAGSVISLSRLG